MNETKEAGVKTEPFRRVTLSPIFFIAHNRAAERGELDAELVAPSSFQGEFDERSVPVLFQGSHVGDGMTGEGGGGTNKNFKGIGFVEVGFDGV